MAKNSSIADKNDALQDGKNEDEQHAFEDRRRLAGKSCDRDIDRDQIGNGEHRGLYRNAAKHVVEKEPGLVLKRGKHRGHDFR